MTVVFVDRAGKAGQDLRGSAVVDGCQDKQNVRGTMAAKRHSNDDNIQPGKAGGGVAQGIVELLSATSSGLIFWSRHPFELAAELQLRVRSNALPACLTDGAAPWQTKRGFVVQCQPARRSNGSVGFQVSVLFVPAVLEAGDKPKLGRLANVWRFELEPNLVRRLSGLN